MMKKRYLALLIIFVGSMMICGLALEYLGYIPLWLYEAYLIGSFPVLVLGIGLWWMAREHEEDIPFIGY